MASNFRLITAEHLDSLTDAFASHVVAMGYEEKANLKAMAYVDELTKDELASALKTKIEGKMDAADAQDLISEGAHAVYKAGGSYAFAQLPTPSDTTYGYVYNVLDDFTSDARFVDGAGGSYNAGVNVVVVSRPSYINLPTLPANTTVAFTGAGLVDGTVNGAGVITYTTTDTAIDATLKDALPINSVVFVPAASGVVGGYLSIVSYDETNPQALVVNGTVVEEPVPNYLYDALAGMIDDSLIGTKTDLQTAQQKLDGLQIATQPDIQDIINGLSLDPPVTPTKITVDASKVSTSGNTVVSYVSKVEEGFAFIPIPSDATYTSITDPSTSAAATVLTGNDSVFDGYDTVKFASTTGGTEYAANQVVNVTLNA